MIVAIGDGGLFPVVWGLGVTTEEARLDAEQWSDPGDPTVGTWDANGTAYLEVTDECAARIRAGQVNCHALGIHVRCDHTGRIVGAETTDADLNADGYDSSEPDYDPDEDRTP